MDFVEHSHTLYPKCCFLRRNSKRDIRDKIKLKLTKNTIIMELDISKYKILWPKTYYRNIELDYEI